ncbi:unnamed protein product [Camellia sinensis]
MVYLLLHLDINFCCIITIMFMKMMMAEKFHQFLHAFVIVVLLLFMKPALGLSSRVEDAKTKCIERERQALLKFKYDLIDDYGILSSWGSEEDKKDCCKWRGVGCNNHTGHVTMLDLHVLYNYSLDPPYRALRGKSSPSLLELQHLKYLDLSGNEFHDDITKLRNLSNLQYLDLGDNYDLKCGNLEWLSHLSLLSHLDLSYVNLSKATDWVQSINNLPLLKELSWLFNFSSSLIDVALSDNQLKGLIPDSFGGMISLANLSLGSNHLEGQTNRRTGNSNRRGNVTNNGSGSQAVGGNQGQEFGHQEQAAIPNPIEMVQVLQTLQLNGNQITGSLPDLSMFPSLTYLQLRDNQLNVFLGPHFPKWLQTQNNFTELDISSNGISDVPSWFWDLSPGLNFLNLSNNLIKGLLPDLSLKYHGYLEIDLSSNHFSGPIPLAPPNVTLLNLSKNKFSGSLSFLCPIRGTKLTYLDLSNNSLSGELPSCWVHLKALTVISLANNNLYGKIPSSMGSLGQIHTLHLRNNNFSGEVPSSLKRCKKLIMIDLGGNKLTGKIPAWIGAHLTSLIVVSLRFNEFRGSIPRHICHLNQIQIVDFSHNRLSGNIPNCFHNFTALVESKSSIVTISSYYKAFYGSYFRGGSYIENALVLWKGQESEYGSTLGLLKSIDLSSNELIGKIPKQVGSLAGLVSLNLSRNNLTGNIIQEVGRMKMLESLDLSANELSGAIPTSLADLNFLSVLNLSHNRLVGKIPISTQLQSFDPSVYSGNLELCGLPLPNKCPGEEIVVEPVLVRGKDKRIQEDDDKFITTGFYVSMGLGFTFGFWTVFGTMIFNKPSRHTYFEFLESIKSWFYVTTALSMARLQRKLQRSMLLSSAHWSQDLSICYATPERDTSSEFRVYEAKLSAPTVLYVFLKC